MTSKLPFSTMKLDRGFHTGMKDDKPKTPNSVGVPTPTSKKYAHIQSKVKTFWTAQEMQKAGVQKFFERKGTSSASTSASTSAATSPETELNRTALPLRRQIKYEISGPDFAARLMELKNGIGSSSDTSNATSQIPTKP